MKPLFLTAAYEEGSAYAEMIEDWRPHHEDYCQRFGYEYRALIGPQTLTVDARAYSPLWVKAALILERLKSGEHDFFFWLDTDAVIADTRVDLRSALPSWAWLGMTIHPYSAGEDVWHWQSGVIYVRA
jgi:hypothetical protein